MFYVPTDGVESWRLRLAEPTKHWKSGRSAMMLANCWESAGAFPSEIAEALRPSFEGLQFIAGFPEHRTPLPGGRRGSQSDILVHAATDNGLLVIAVEGKVNEGFGKPIAGWLGDDPSPGKQERLAFLSATLGTDQQDLSEVPYQLVHRTVAAVLEAGRYRAAPMMLVHSWGYSEEGIDDYVRFAEMLGAQDAGRSPAAGRLPDGSPIWFGWVTGDERWRLMP